jgi:hypothetical protein
MAGAITLLQNGSAKDLLFTYYALFLINFPFTICSA